MALTPGALLRVATGLAALVGDELAGALTEGGNRSPAVRSDTTDRDVDHGVDLLHLLWGAAADATDRARSSLATLSRPMGAAVDLGTWVLAAPPLRSTADRMRSTIDGLVERGRAESVASRTAAADVADRVLWLVVRSTVVDDVVVDVLQRAIGPALDEMRHRPEDLVLLVDAIVADAIGPILDRALPVAFEKIHEQPELLVPVLEAVVEEALQPMLREILPQVFEVLADDPAAVRELVRDQSTGVAAEMAGAVRVQAARADDHVDRIVRRVLRRHDADAEAEHETPALPAGER